MSFITAGSTTRPRAAPASSMSSTTACRLRCALSGLAIASAASGLCRHGCRWCAALRCSALRQHGLVSRGTFLLTTTIDYPQVCVRVLAPRCNARN
eukprot:2218769-Rhodomonas_salina.1